MIEERATVVAREGTHAWVERERQSACGSCSVNKGCGTGVLAQVVGRRYTRLKAMNPVDAQPGDTVVLGVAEGALVQGSLAVYLVPLLGLFVFGLLGETLAVQLNVAAGDALVAAFGVAGLALGLAWLRRHSTRLADDPRYQAVILRREPAAMTIPARQATKESRSL
ncbi:SoxR reducing system RseC family protein [Ectothiorhodospiraceae bacterium 2226]|nr:SoxR reducing system RseC family protein [Ectothiorhodospiraceae bacterium 2226]